MRKRLLRVWFAKISRPVSSGEWTLIIEDCYVATPEEGF